MLKKFTFYLLILLTTLSCSKTKKSNEFSVGIIADCQYCECDASRNNYYKKAPQRLKEAVNELNKHEIAFTVHLGDFINQDISSFDSLAPTWNKLTSDSYHVLGNHDFDVVDSLKPKVLEKLNLKKRYYSIDKNNWKFLFLDGTDLSFYGTFDSLKQRETQTYFDKIKKDSLPYAKIYNGGLSQEQFKWIEKELEIAKNNNQYVGFYCHFPLLPINNGNLWNIRELQALIEKNKHVKVFMNGHKHKGDYAFKNGVHYLTLKGMVQTEDSTAYAKAHFFKDSIKIKGYGRELNRVLKITE